VAPGTSAPYPQNLTPKASPLRPHCPAKDRLRLWIPHGALSTPPVDAGVDTSLGEELIQRIRTVKSFAWAGSTLEAYGTGLLTYMVFCDEQNVPESERAPTSPKLLQAFIATLAGAYAGSTVINFVCGIRAWHILHGIPWAINKEETDALIKGARALAPASSKKAPRPPLTLDMISKIRDHLNLTKPIDAAVFACLTTSFWGAARLGETTVTKRDAYNPATHASRGGVVLETDRSSGRVITKFKLPRTKTEKDGEFISWMPQEGPADPEAAWVNHLKVNSGAPSDAHLFAYKHGSEWRPLSRREFSKSINAALKAAGLPPMQGHSIRIGAALEYLLRGVSFETLKVKGRWKSDAYRVYLRDHAQILAPHMQALPEQHQAFVRHSTGTTLVPDTA
jgi:hypothetical protein